MDMYLFGLIYAIVFEDKTVDTTNQAELREKIEAKIVHLKSDENHKRAPSALKYLKARINASIEIYNEYIDE